MPKIKITPETLDDRARELQKLKDQHNQVYAQITKLVNNVVDIWEGDAQTAFRNTFQQRDPVFKKFAEDADAFAKLMNMAAQRMRETEAELKSKMKV